MSTRRLKTTESAPLDWTVFWIVLGCIALLWFFSDILAIAIFYIPGKEIVDQELFDRAKDVMTISLTLIFALTGYMIVVRSKMSEKTVTAVSKETVNDLMLSREQFRKLYDDSPVPYFLMDDAGNIRSPNRAALRFFGGTLEDCASTNFYTLLLDDGKVKKAVSLLKAKVEHSVPISQEEMCIRQIKKKKELYALVSIYSLEHTSPIPFKHLVTLVDVTREKESERVKTDFLLLASHQLRTPLTAVKWNIDYLLSSDKLGYSDTVRDYLEQIYIGNERMIELITTLLTVSRIEMGTLAPEFARIHINTIIDDILDELAPEMQKRKTKIKIETSGDDELIMDRTMTRIIIHNLLTNAIKYTPVGGDVLITTNYSQQNCTISVKDSGYGIPIDEQEKIFTKMFRASNARKVSTNGTGLGLYLCKAFAEKLGGTISFSSEEGKGTTFTITLPRVALGA